MNNNLNFKQAAILTTCGALAFSIMVAFSKLAIKDVPNDIIIFFRYSVSLIYILSIISINKIRKRQVVLKTKYLRLHLVLAASTIATLLLLYYSLNYISILDATLLNTTYPLFMPILTVILLNRKTPKKVWSGLIIGFIGIAFVLKPSPMIFNPIALLALASGLTASIGIFTMRQLSKRENHRTLMFYFFFITAIGSGILAFFNWHTPSYHSLLLLLAIGVFGTIYQEFLIRASRHAQARVISSLMYTNIIFSGLFGWIIWNDIPDAYDWIGIVLVCFGAILTIFYASRNNMYKTRTRKTKS
jgi:drug/metabolite transporter (DMT)-like permease